MIHDTPHSYGNVSRLLHWGMAAAFFLMLGTAVAWKINEDYFDLLSLHKSVGFILMVLIVLRLIWAALNLRRRPAAAITVKLGHAALYLLMLAVPLSALLRQYGSARKPLNVFGIEVMPAAAEKIQWMLDIGHNHAFLAWTLYALIGGHIVIALIHQIKGEKILNRMIGRRS